jgi:O-antigen ligase
LQLAVGDYWGYLYVTVDDERSLGAAYALPVIRGNVNSQGQLGGYRTFYAPEQQTAAGPSAQWVKVYKGDGSALTREARMEVWRSWGQTPLRGVAVLEPTTGPSLEDEPVWPGVLALVLGGWCALFALRKQILLHPAVGGAAPAPAQRSWLFIDNGLALFQGMVAAALSASLTIAGVTLNQWWIVLAGLGFLFLVSLHRPAIWLAALLFGLPFYYRFPLPILPWRSLGLIDAGLLGGILLLIVRNVWNHRQDRQRLASLQALFFDAQFLLLAALISWALVATFAADHFAVALREWRTVFLSAGLFALLLIDLKRTHSDSPGGRFTYDSTDLWLLLRAWVAGATVTAAVALGQYFMGVDIISAEGVWRVRAFYGSPNNLALYLERTLAVSLALAIFAPSLRGRLMWGVLALVQGLALVLTFSKGALLLGLPAMLVTLWLGGIFLLRRHGRSPQPLWWVAGAGILAMISVVPFLDTERFQRLLDFSQGTGFLRLNLWRSSWQMALDHPLLGVGPDNFLYAYRSEYLLPAAWQEPNLNHPHNVILDWWTRLGLPGLALASVLLAAMVRRLWRCLHLDLDPALALGFLAATAAALAHGLIDASYALPDLMLVWVLIAYFPHMNGREKGGEQRDGNSFATA